MVRIPSVEQPLGVPQPIIQAQNLVSAVGQATLNPKLASTEEQERRLAICTGNDTIPKCEFYLDGRCAKCGCHLNWKVKLEAWHCPISKW